MTNKNRDPKEAFVWSEGDITIIPPKNKEAAPPNLITKLKDRFRVYHNKSNSPKAKVRRR